MQLDTVTYFLVILAGFGIVWGFRKGINRHARSLNDFEYLGFSAFWGTLVFGGLQWIYKDKPDQFAAVLMSPPAVGLFLFPICIVIGFLVGYFVHKTPFYKK